MRRPTTAALLEAWERGRTDPPRRALALLHAAGEDQPGQLGVGRRDALLIELRHATFGNEVQGVVDCEPCGEALELAFRLGEVLVRDSKGDAAPLVEWVGGRELRFRLPTTDDLLAVTAAAQDRRALLQRCLVGGDQSVAELPEEVVDRVESLMDAADPQAEVRLAVTCPACAATSQVSFDIASFLWWEVEAWARGLLLEVHTLARAYGWTESEILDLSPGRRRVYLDLAGA